MPGGEHAARAGKRMCTSSWCKQALSSLEPIALTPHALACAAPLLTPARVQRSTASRASPPKVLSLPLAPRMSPTKAEKTPTIVPATHLHCSSAQLLQHGADRGLDVRRQVLHNRRTLLRAQRPGVGGVAPAGGTAAAALCLLLFVRRQIAQERVGALPASAAQQVARQRGGGGLVVGKQVGTVGVQLQPARENRGGECGWRLEVAGWLAADLFLMVEEPRSGAGQVGAGSVGRTGSRLHLAMFTCAARPLPSRTVRKQSPAPRRRRRAGGSAAPRPQ